MALNPLLVEGLADADAGAVKGRRMGQICVGAKSHDLGQGVWVVFTGRCGCLRWVGSGDRQKGGFDLRIGSDGYFDFTG